MVLTRFRETINILIERLSRPLIKLGIKAIYLSITSLLLTGVASLLITLSDKQRALILSGAILFIFSSMMDALDGAVARLRGEVSEIGAFTDSIVDRVNEILIISSLILSELVRLEWGLAFLSTSLLISYVRARGESLGLRVEGVGLMERAERVILIAIGLFLWFFQEEVLNYVFIIGSVMNVITITQRIAWIGLRLKSFEKQA